MNTVNRSAIVVKPKQPVLDWLHAADPSSREICLSDLSQEPTTYLVRECDTDADVVKVVCKLCEEIFEEQLAGWYTDASTWPRDRSYPVFRQWFQIPRHNRS